MITADNLPKSGADGPDRGEVGRIVKVGKGVGEVGRGQGRIVMQVCKEIVRTLRKLV